MKLMKCINLVILFCFYSCYVAAQGWVDVLRGVNDVIGATSAQVNNSRNSLRKSINNWGECKGGALSNYCGSIAFYGSNGYSFTAAVPARLKEVLSEKHDKGDTFNDVTITDGGAWLLIYNETGYIGYGMPSGLKSAMDNLEEERIQSASFNDKGEWILVTNETVYTSHNIMTRFFKSYEEVYGKIMTASVFAGGAVACYENGYTFYGNIPVTVVNGISAYSYTPYFVKFDSYGNFLICSKNAGYKYKLNDLGDINPNSVAWVSNTTPYGTQSLPQTSGSSSVPYPTIPPVGNSGTGSASEVKCSGCRGTGRCTACNGTGKQKSEAYYTGGGTIISDCPVCRGSRKCGTCNGKGTL